MSINNQRMFNGVADLSKLTSNKRIGLSKLFSEYNTDITSYSKNVLDRKETQAKDTRLEGDELYGALNQHKKLLEQRNKNKNYKNLDNGQRSDYLTFMASRPEINEVMTKMCNELIVTHENESRFAVPKIKDLDLKELGFSKKVIDSISENININFNDFYKKLGFSRDGAWKQMYDFLKNGKKAYEIIYDDVENPKRILHFIEIDPNSLEFVYREGIKYWLHTPVDPNMVGMGGTASRTKTLLYDHQIIYIDWNSDMINTEYTSYMEQLIKPYNFMRILDETRVIWAVTNSTFRTLYSIPTSNQGRNRAEQSVKNFTEMYKDNYDIDVYSGDISINGKNNLMFSKDLFMSSGDSGNPEISTIGGEGAELQSIEPNEMFQKKFYRASGMPYGRFDTTSNETWNVDPTSIYREEVDFDRYKARIRDIFGKILIKPILYQLVLDYPALHDESDISDNILLDFTSYSEFGRMMEQEILKSQFEFVDAMRNTAQTELADGTVIPMFSMEYILKKYLGYDDKDIELIDEMRIKEIKKNLEIEKEIKEIRKSYGITVDEEPDTE